MIWSKVITQILFGGSNSQDNGSTTRFLEQDNAGTFSLDKEVNQSPYNPYVLNNMDFLRLIKNVLADKKLQVIKVMGVTCSQKVVKTATQLNSSQIITALANIQYLTAIMVKEKASNESAIIHKNGVIQLSKENDKISRDLATILNRQ